MTEHHEDAPVSFQCPLLSPGKAVSAPQEDPAMEQALEAFIRLEESLSAVSGMIGDHQKWGASFQDSMNNVRNEVRQTANSLNGAITAANKLVSDARVAAEETLKAQKKPMVFDVTITIAAILFFLIAGGVGEYVLSQKGFTFTSRIVYK